MIANFCKFYKMEHVAKKIKNFNLEILNFLKILTFIIVLINCVDFTLELGHLIYLQIIKLNNLI